MIKDDLVLRLGGEAADEALRDAAVRPMDFTGRPKKGFLYVDPTGTRRETELRAWITRALEYVETLPPKKEKTKKR